MGFFRNIGAAFPTAADVMTKIRGRQYGYSRAGEVDWCFESGTPFIYIGYSNADGFLNVVKYDITNIVKLLAEHKVTLKDIQEINLTEDGRTYNLRVVIRATEDEAIGSNPLYGDYAILQARFQPICTSLYPIKEDQEKLQVIYYNIEDHYAIEL